VAADLSAGPTAAYAVAKSLINQASGMAGLDVHLDRELESLVRIADGAEFAEGLSGFFEKRAPRFSRPVPDEVGRA
jgi:enoyl-CoA hydratase/carnithine racemase